MLTPFQWISLVSVLLIAFAGGYLPLIEHCASRRGFLTMLAGLLLTALVRLLLGEAHRV